MQDAVNILENLVETSLLITGVVCLLFWIAERKPTNLEMLYIFAAVSAGVLAINLVDSSLWLLFVLLSWIPAGKKAPNYFLPKKEIFCPRSQF